MSTDRRHAILRVILMAAIVGIGALIYFFSSQDGEESSRLSGGVTQLLIRLFVPGYSTMTTAEKLALTQSMSYFVRKAAHFSEYALFAALLMNYLRLRLPGDGLGMPGALGWLLATIYAGTDEWHQMFVGGRGPAVLDVCIDSAGALTGVLLTGAALAVYIRRKQKRIS